jgi:signal transduction histidine kinase
MKADTQTGSSRLDRTSRISAERELVDVVTWWQKTQSLLATGMPPGIHLHGAFPARLPPIAVNEGMLMRAVLNLAVNAADAVVEMGRSGGEVEVWAGADPDDPQHLLLGVRDNGPGIEPRLRERIFGTVTVESELGVGTNFVLHLPIALPLQASD